MAARVLAVCIVDWSEDGPTYPSACRIFYYTMSHRTGSISCDTIPYNALPSRSSSHDVNSLQHTLVRLSPLLSLGFQVRVLRLQRVERRDPGGADGGCAA